MNYAKFVGRRKELEYLRSEFNSKGHRFIPVWGRRRVGKTTLILKAMAGKGLYFMASEVSEKENLELFKQEAARVLKDPTILSLAPDWEVLFRYLSKIKMIITIDEFPYLISADAKIPSLFQRIIDTHLSGSEVKLVLCGSSVRMMEDSVLDYKAPLYGRRTGQIHLSPLIFKDIKNLIREMSFDDRVRVYGAVGGIPLYLLQFEEKVGFWKNVEEKILSPHSLLYLEADILMKQEFKTPSTYKSILKEVASGKTKMEEIRNALGVGKSDISPYINNLSLVGFIEREVSITQDPLKSRKGIYVVKDNYMKFFYRYVLPNRSLLEAWNTKAVISAIKKDYDSYLGRVFEQVAREAVLEWSSSKELLWDKIGRWWQAGEEIDLVGMSRSRNEILFCEVKWSAKPIGPSTLKALLEKAQFLKWGSRGRSERFLVISRGGFNKDAKAFARTNKIILWTVKDLERIFKTT